MNQYKYNNYEEYKKIQIDGNIKKIKKCGIVIDNLKIIAIKYIKPLEPRFGICHGTRRGIEQKTFKEILNCDVIGTEISPTATQFPDTIQWDFHDIKNEWINNIDFIYTNSWDHCFDPIKAFNNWMKCLKNTGVCILEYNLNHKRKVDELDSFKGSLEELLEFIKNNVTNSKISIDKINNDYSYILVYR